MDERQRFINMTQAFTRVAQEQGIALRCSVDGTNVAGGEDPTDADANLAALPQGADADNISCFTPSMQLQDSPCTNVDPQVPYAAIAAIPTVSVATASMPAVQFKFLSENGNSPISDSQRTAMLDTGCNVNLISVEAVQRDWRLFGAQAKLQQVRPFHVRLADGKTQANTVQILRDVKIVLGHAWYSATFLVVEKLAHEYMLGWPFMLQYDVHLHPHDRQLEIGLPIRNLLVKPKKLPVEKYQL